MWLPEDEQAQQTFRVTPGFIGFVALIFSPVIIALAVYLGAWLVADEVEAAEARAQTSQSDAVEVEGWKRTLVGICPAH
jgi:hypothetical protein